MARPNRTRMLPVVLQFSILILAQFACQTVQAVDGRSLYLTIDKTICTSGETVTIRVYIGKESCKEHGHYVDVYVYDSKNFLVHRVYFEKASGLAVQPGDFPLNVTYTPTRVDVYTVKLWVIHWSPWGHPVAILEDTLTFSVVPYTTAVVTTTPLATMTTSVTVITTVHSYTTTTLTSTEMETAKIDSATVSILLVIAVLIIAAFEMGRRRGRRTARQPR